VFVYFIHAIYFALFLLHNKQNVESLNLKLDAKIKVASGAKFKILSLYSVIYVYSEFGITYIIDSNYKKYTSNLTLKELESMFDESFFRANRKIIVSRNIVDSYKSSTNGKVEIILKENVILEISEPIIISRDKASSFRSWVNKHLIV
jgi:DNA-binding LytR/AlgR family response regulator